MTLLGKHTRLQLLVFSPAVAAWLFMLVEATADWKNRPQIAFKFIVSTTMLYIGAVYIAGPGGLILQMQDPHRPRTLKAWRWSGAAYIASGCLLILSALMS